jgi:hypothetical protein
LCPHLWHRPEIHCGEEIDSRRDAETLSEDLATTGEALALITSSAPPRLCVSPLRYLKYASKPVGTYREFVFTFFPDHLNELSVLRAKTGSVFVGLICVSAKQICSVDYETLLRMIAERKRLKRAEEESYTLLVTSKGGQRFRVYMSPPGEKKKKISEQVVPRNAFPGCLFS